MAHRTVGAKQFGSSTPLRVVLHGLRRSPLVDRRLNGQTTCSWEICHLLGEYTVARPVRMQGRPVSRRGPSEKAEQMLRFDLENENETIRNYRDCVRQCALWENSQWRSIFARSFYRNRTIRSLWQLPWES